MRLLFFIGLALLVASSILACGSITPSAPVAKPKTQPPATVENQQPAAVPPSEASGNEAGWTAVKSFIGKEGTTTPAFSISGSKWRIIWTVDAQYPQYAVFDVLVYPQDNLAMLTKRISYSKDMSGDTVYIDEGGRDYYLKVISANLAKWTITVEDYASGSPSQPVQITNIHYKGSDYDNSVAAGHDIVEWDEYVEIKNLSDSPQNVAGWTLKNITKGAPTFLFPTFTPCSCSYYGNWSECMENCYPPRHCSIEPRKSIRVYTGEPQWESGGYCFYYYPGDIWNNEIPDTAVLYNAGGQEVSRKSYVIPASNTVKSVK
ncbi:MAG: lamin tail domain-containing protein [Dehalococcoidia bacterium]